METAKAVLSIQPLNNGFTRHVPISTPAAEGDDASFRVAQSGGQIQMVASASDTEESGLSDKRSQRDKQQLADAVKNMNDFLQVTRRTLQFTMDEDTGEMVVTIKDAETEEVIRQIPPENILKLAKELGKLKGLLFEERA